MNLFLLALLPVSIFIFYINKDKDNRAYYLPVIFSGIFSASLFLAYKLLFSSVYYIPRANIFANFLYYFFSQALIPVSVIYGLFFLFARKDSLEDRFAFFFPIVASFYAVFLPYIILESQKPYPGFLLFLKPLMFLSMFIVVHTWLNKIPSVKSASELVVSIVIMVVALCIPAITESMWVVDLFPICWIIPAVLLCGYAAFIVFPKDSGKN